MFAFVVVGKTWRLPDARRFLACGYLHHRTAAGDPQGEHEPHQPAIVAGPGAATRLEQMMTDT
jgi:hypothetical protein